MASKFPIIVAGLASLAFAAPAAQGATATAAAGLTGSTAVQSRAATNPAGQAVAFRTRARTTGAVRRLNFYLDPRSTVSKVSVGLYSSKRGKPSARLGSCHVDQPGAGRWSSCGIPTTKLRAGHYYYTVLLQAHGVKGVLSFRAQTVRTSRSFRTVSRSLRALPSRFGHTRRGGHWLPSIFAGAPGTLPVAGDDGGSTAGGSGSGSGSGPTGSGTSTTTPPSTGAGSGGTTTTPPASNPPATTPPASNSGWPDATNTGLAGCPSTLTRSSGLTVTQNNAVIQNMDLTGQLDVEANNVTIKCVRITNTGSHPLRLDNGTGTVVQHVEVNCQSSPSADAAVMGSDYSVQYANIHDCEDAFHAGRNVTISDSYVHDLNNTDSGAHYDAIQLTGCACFTVNNVLIQHNTLLPRSRDATSAIIIKSDFGPIDGVTVNNNKMNYGAYTVYSRDGGYGNPTNVKFTNNRFGRNYTFGLRSFDGSVGWSGNVWDDTGATIAP